MYNLPIDTYPTAGATNAGQLFSSLGYFWTQAFGDKAALRGLCQANAEEIYQVYYNLLEAINSYSAANIDVFHKVKWLPLVFKRSQLNSSPFLFTPDQTLFGTVVGSQPYVFGQAPPQESNVYTINVADTGLVSAPIIVDRIISPTKVLINNQDIQLQDDILYFYGDPFQISNAAIVPSYNTDGSPQTFTAFNGAVLQDATITLWVYNGELDQDQLNLNLGYLLGYTLPNTYQSRDIFAATINLFSNGPSVQQLTQVCGAFLGVSPVKSDNETVLDIVTTNGLLRISTDKNSYVFDAYYQPLPNVQVGRVLHAGDPLVNAIELYDNVSHANWWQTKLVPEIVDGPTLTKSPGFTVPKEMFLGNYNYGLTFDNSMELVTVSAAGKINFPVTGDPRDVASFNAWLTANSETVLPLLGNPTSAQPTLVNPMDLIFQILFKFNSMLIRINFKDETSLQSFADYFKILQAHLPSHVYFIFYFNVTVPGEEYHITHTNDGTPTFTPEVLYGSGHLEQVGLNNSPSSGGLRIKECLLAKTIPTGIDTEDYNWLYFTKLP